MNVVFQKRDFTYESINAAVAYNVERYSFHATGGPKEAKIEVSGPDLAMWELFEKVRAPVKIHSDLGDEVWWGYLSGIDGVLRNPFSHDKGYVRIGVSIDGMANRMCYAYTLLDPATGGLTRETTAWAEDTTSISAYGTVELMMSRSYATGAHATAALNTKLAQLKYPQPIITPEGSGASQMTLTCRGWWNTLDFPYYSNTGTADVDTALQVGTIINQEGEFLQGVINDLTGGTSGISAPLFRDGDAKALAEVTDILESGTNAAKRMLTYATPDRYVRLYEEPAATTYYMMDTQGNLYDAYGAKQRAELCPAGIWVKMRDMLPPSLDISLLADPTLVFVEEMEYNPRTKRLKMTPRGHLDPWDFPVVQDG